MNYGKLTDSERAAHNAAVLSKVTVLQSAVEAFKPALKVWRAEYGSKPTDAMLMAGYLLGNKHQKPGGVEALSIAMMLRPEGCVSGSEYQLAAVALTGRSVGPANNKRKALVLAKVFHETSAGKPARYWLTFMPAGEKALDAYNAAHVQAVTPNTQPVKAKKAKAKKAKPVTETAPSLAAAPEVQAIVEQAVEQAISDERDAQLASDNLS